MLKKQDDSQLHIQMQYLQPFRSGIVGLIFKNAINKIPQNLHLPVLQIIIIDAYVRIKFSNNFFSDSSIIIFYIYTQIANIVNCLSSAMSSILKHTFYLNFKVNKFDRMFNLTIYSFFLPLIGSIILCVVAFKVQNIIVEHQFAIYLAGDRRMQFILISNMLKYACTTGVVQISHEIC
jgi:hypothetical protein